ncbi:MAG: hypothetical protein KC492_20040 [Myxococcales bacterium]|nr:hypothetical protein [Myxococcales bacterium]
MARPLPRSVTRHTNCPKLGRLAELELETRQAAPGAPEFVSAFHCHDAEECGVKMWRGTSASYRWVEECVLHPDYAKRRSRA